MERIGAATYFVLNLVAATIIAGVYVLLALKLSALMTGLVFVCGAGLMLVLKGKTQGGPRYRRGALGGDAQTSITPSRSTSAE